MAVDDIRVISSLASANDTGSMVHRLSNNGSRAGSASPIKASRHLAQTDQVIAFSQQGYVSVASLSMIRASVVVISQERATPTRARIDIELSCEQVLLESCADSTQTLIQIINALKPPVLPIAAQYKYRTELSSLIDVFSEIDLSAFTMAPGLKSSSDSDSDMSTADFVSDDLPSNLEFVESYYGDGAVRSNWTNSSSSSGSLNATYSKADLLLDEDLSSLAANATRSRVSQEQKEVDGTSRVVQFTDPSLRKYGSFEQRVQSHESILHITDDHFGIGDTMSGKSSNSLSPAKSLNSSGPVPELSRGATITKRIPDPLAIRVKIHDTKAIWNLHDGYDWEYTRETINHAVKRVEIEALESRRRRMQSSESDQQLPTPSERLKLNEPLSNQSIAEEDEQSEIDTTHVIGDLLFNSIYIGMMDGQEPEDLRREINKGIDDASDTVSQSSSRGGLSSSPEPRNKTPKDRYGRLRLRRSKQYKMRIELRGIVGEVNLFAGVNDLPGRAKLAENDPGQLLNVVDLRVHDVEVFDNVSTSTWNKFLTYMRSAGEREAGASMIHAIVETVKPDIDLATSELIINVSVLPLRLHVDQDTLDFTTRFFEFKDERFDSIQSDEIPFIQKVDIRAVKVKLDYKPKLVDYAGLRSGHTTEFMNFFILDEAEMILKRIVLHGISGFPRMSHMLNGIWMPDIRGTQLGGVLAGLAPVRSIVKLGSGLQDLIVIPVREYRKDGRVVRGISKGAWSFARTTTNELVKFGAKLAAGTQTILETAEQAMGGSGSQARNSKSRYISAYDDNIEAFEEGTTLSAEQEEVPLVTNSQGNKVPARSLYADQPTGVVQGLKSAYTSLGRNLNMAKDAVVDISSESTGRGSAQGAAMAVAKAAPIALIRPMIGATEAVSKTLLGVTNQLEPARMQDVEDVSVGD